MPGVKIDSRGVVNTKGSGDLTISLLTILSGGLQTNSAITASAGVQLQQGTFISRVSGAFGASGFLAIGRTTLTGSNSGVLLSISGAAGEGKRCAIELHSTGSVLRGAEGNIGIEGTPQVGACFIFWDENVQRLKYKTSAGSVQTIHVTGAL